ncbi:TPA: hypothetical protein KPJ62_002633 [Clostridioides difficile]|nr:hypothetical protein [Clostridioides difficile]
MEKRMFKIVDKNDKCYGLSFELIEIQKENIILDVIGTKLVFKEDNVKEIHKKNFCFYGNKTKEQIDEIKAFFRHEAIEIYKQKYNIKSIVGLKVVEQNQKLKKKQSKKKEKRQYKNKEVNENVNNILELLSKEK